MIRVLVVDDSEVYRLFLRGILSHEKDIEIVSMASNGRLALPRVHHYKPEIILLDYDMPEMDGLAAIPEFKRLSPQSRIIMFSSHTRKGAKLTIDALQLGADEFITKPSEALVGGNAESLRLKLLERIRAFTTPELARADNRLASPGAPNAVQRDGLADWQGAGRKSKHFRYCAIGISTGGPPALRKLFSALPKDLQGSIFVVQHMPPLFTAQLAESLGESSPLKILEAKNGMVPEAGTVYIAPGGKQMRLRSNEKAEKHIVVEESEPQELCKPSVNILFHSFAEICPEETLAIIMTGMGEDGYAGMKELSSKGAYLMAQKADDCVIFGMPAKPIRDGIVHEIHPVEGLAAQITEYLR
ncbi:MAG: chemotaxis-specific protein-glutamate methyltransferase CheB [Turneriella sp.]